MSNEFPFLKDLRSELMARAADTLKPAPERRAALWSGRRGWVVASATFLVVVTVGTLWGLLLTTWRGGEVQPDHSAASEATGGEEPLLFDAEYPEGTVTLCATLVWPSAPAAWYRAEPVYGDATALIDQVELFATTLEGYERIWVDMAHNGWVTVGFVGSDVVERQRQLETAFPDAGVVAVEMSHSVEQLEALRNEIVAELPEGMVPYRVYETEGYVGVWVGVLTLPSLAELSAVVAGRPICADGYPPDAVVEAGPQLQDGDGWRYLGEYDYSIGRESRVITTESALRELLELLEAPSSPPVDFSAEIVITFEVGVSSTCPETRFDGVATADGLLYATIVDPSIGVGPPQLCTFEHIARTYVVAVDRDLLPAPPFIIKANPDYVAQTRVTVDLREPGSTVQP